MCLLNEILSEVPKDYPGYPGFPELLLCLGHGCCSKFMFQWVEALLEYSCAGLED